MDLIPVTEIVIPEDISPEAIEGAIHRLQGEFIEFPNVYLEGSGENIVLVCEDNDYTAPYMLDFLMRVAQAS